MIPLVLHLLFFLIISPILLYFAAKRRNGYWQKRGISGPKSSPLRGNLDSVFGIHPTALKFWEWTREYGRVYGIQYGWFQALVISDPKMVHEMLVDKFEQFHGRLLSPSDGDTDTKPEVNIFTAKGIRWKRLRTISNPAFSVANLKKVMPIMSDSIRESMRLLGEANREGKPVDLIPHFVEMTSDVISRVALGQTEYSQFRVVSRFANVDVTLGNLTIEKGTAVFTDSFSLHRDKSVWGDDAEEFRPERWLEPMGNAQNVFAGFGGGPRICIGMRFAILELKMAMCHLLRKFVIKKCEQTQEHLELHDHIVLDTASVIVRLEERSNR